MLLSLRVYAVVIVGGLDGRHGGGKMKCGVVTLGFRVDGKYKYKPRNKYVVDVLERIIKGVCFLVTFLGLSI